MYTVKLVKFDNSFVVYYLIRSSLTTVVNADMYEPMHFPDPFCRFSLEHLTSLQLPAAAETDGRSRGLDSAAEIRDDSIASPASVSAPSLQLNHSELWQKFFAVGTEMVITKSGRHVYVLHDTVTTLKLQHLFIYFPV